MLFSKTGLQEGLHRHAPVREGGGWCPRQQWVLPAIVIVVNVSIIIIIQYHGCFDFFRTCQPIFNDPYPGLLFSTLFCPCTITENTICKECQLLTFFPTNVQ